MTIDRDRARRALAGLFVADAAAAGLHWIYDQDEVARRAGNQPAFRPPAQNDYHKNRALGEFTHYGDHALLALESVVACGGLDVADYQERLRKRCGADGYDGYLDHATKDLLETGGASDDDQAGAFAKLAVIAAKYGDDDELDARLEESIRATHDNADAVAYGVAAGRAIAGALRGADASEVVAAALGEGGAPGEAAGRALAAAGRPHAEFAKAEGLACPVKQAYPVALHATLAEEALGGEEIEVVGGSASVEYGALTPRGFRETVNATILAGGDTCGRLLVAAPIAAASDGVPPDWFEKLPQRERVAELIAALLE